MGLIRKRRWLAPLLGIAIVVALIAAGAAYALKASSFTYSSTKTGYVRIHHMAFAPYFGDMFFVNEFGFGLRANDCMVAGVDLPMGSKVKAVTFYFTAPTGGSFRGDLWRRQLSNATSKRLASVSRGTDGTNMQVTDAIAAIDQPVSAQSAYGIIVCLQAAGGGVNAYIYGARVKYTYTSAGS